MKLAYFKLNKDCKIHRFRFNCSVIITKFKKVVKANKTLKSLEKCKKNDANMMHTFDTMG